MAVERDLCHFTTRKYRQDVPPKDNLSLVAHSGCRLSSPHALSGPSNDRQLCYEIDAALQDESTNSDANLGPSLDGQEENSHTSRDFNEVKHSEKRPLSTSKSEVLPQTGPEQSERATLEVGIAQEATETKCASRGESAGGPNVSAAQATCKSMGHKACAHPLTAAGGVAKALRTAAAKPQTKFTSSLVVDPRDPVQFAQWHTKLGHLGFEMVRKLMGFARDLKTPPCSSCTITKAQRQPLPRQSLTKYANVGDCIHSDAMVLRLPTIGGAKNCVTFIDHKSRFGRIYLVKTRDESWLA